MKQTKTQTHHFFLFRHCVRSTSGEMHFLGGKRSKDLKDYIGPNVELPDWGVPEKWCTSDGVTIVENMGLWLAEQGLLKSATGRVRMEIIADSETQRTVDTAWALSRGLADGFQSRNVKTTENSPVVTVAGLGQLFYDPWLFQPLDKDPFSFHTNDKGGICQANYTEEELKESIEDRLDSLPPPSPIPDALEFLMGVAGVGPVGNLSQVFPDAKPKMTYNLKHVEGAPALLNYVAKLAFYSRAGKMGNVFLPNLTNADLYQQLLPWLYWTRDVGQINNPREATTGAVLARTLIHILKEGYIHKSSSNDDGYETTVTIIVGHDGDLDSLATALGVSWEAPPPYLSHGDNSDYLVTPPVSGIHAQYTVAAEKTNRIDLSFLCPVYSSVEASGVNDSWVLNGTGILEQSPLQWSNSETAARWKTSPDSRSTFLEMDRALAQFQQQIRETLDPYSGATNCWAATGSFLQTLSQSNVISGEDSTTMDTVIVSSLGGLVLGLVAMWCLLRKRIPPKASLEKLGESAYEGVANNANDDKVDTDLELI